MPTFGNIDGEESATVTFTVAAVSLTRNSSAELQEILCLGDPDVASSLGLARVTASAPPSTNAALNVRIVSGASTTTDVAFRSLLPSTATDNPFQLAAIAAGYVSSAAPAAGSSGLVVWPVGYSTTINVSSLAGPVITRSSAADMLVTASQGGAPWTMSVVTPVSSAAPASGDSAVIVRQVGYSTTVNVSSLAGRVLVDRNSTAWQTQSAVRTSSGGGVEGSTTQPGSDVLGLHVRVVPSSIQSTGASTVGATSTNTTLISSAAATAYKVFAFSVTSTVVTPSTVSFRSSAASVIWPMVIGSGSSGISGMAMGGVPPPAFLFKTAAAEALTFHTPSSGPEFHVSVSYFV